MGILRACLGRAILSSVRQRLRYQSTTFIPIFLPVIQDPTMPDNVTPLKPDFGPDNCRLPPLPEIHDDAIRQQVFTHRSYHARPALVFEDHPDDPSPDNEKFEHLGDTVLGLCVTTLMTRIYPHLRVGPSTKIRALVVGNSTLASISVMYKLQDRLLLHPAQAVTLRVSTNIQADVVESFIGGLFLEQGLDAVKRWLDPLFTPYAKEAYGVVRGHYGLSPLSEPPVVSPLRTSSAVNVPTDTLTTVGHLALFNQHLQKLESAVEWVYSDQAEQTADTSEAGAGEGDKEQKAPALKGTKTTPLWFVKVMVNGEPYGNGRGNTKKAARNEAAKVGLIKMGIVVWYVGCSLCDFMCYVDKRGGLDLGMHGAPA